MVTKNPIPSPKQSRAIEENPEQSRRQRKIDQTLARVTEVAWALFEAKGYDNVTMEAIGNAADIAKGTLYKYFPSKECILDHYFRSEIQERRDDVQTQLRSLQGFRARLEYLFQLEADYLQDKRVYLAPLLKYRAQNIDLKQNPTGKSGMLAMMVMIFRAAQDAGEIPKKHSAETLAHYLNAMRTSDLFYWQAQPQSSLLERHQQMLQLFLQGVLADQDNAAQSVKGKK
jgi:AcrR family transcriptional regulator